MHIIDGKKIAGALIADIAGQAKKLPFQPVFCDILVGSDPASVQYVKMKEAQALKAGIAVQKAHYPENITTKDLIAEIEKLNKAPNMSGLIVQLPLPSHIDKQQVLDAIDPIIDVDATGRINSEKFYSGESGAVMYPTAASVLKILEATGEDLKKKKIVIVGFGQLVGKPVSFLLKSKGLKVDVVTSMTENISKFLKNADVVISAAGSPGLITGDQLKKGCIVVDAGTSEENGGIVGDVDFKSVKDVASYLSPVPGGVGPVTVALLLKNVVDAAKKIAAKKIKT